MRFLPSFLLLYALGHVSVIEYGSIGVLLLRAEYLRVIVEVRALAEETDCSQYPHVLIMPGDHMTETLITHDVPEM